MLKFLHMAKIHKIPELYASCIKVKPTTNLLRQSIVPHALFVNL